MFPYPFMELMSTLLIGVLIYWPPYILMHVQLTCIEWYEKARLRSKCCPSMIATWVMLFIFHSIAYAAWIMHMFVIPPDGMVETSYMLAGIVLFFVHMGAWHYWFSYLFVQMKTRGAFAWSIIGTLATLATAVMFLFDEELISTILMFIDAVIGIAFVVITGHLWWCDPCAPEGMIRKKARRCMSEQQQPGCEMFMDETGAATGTPVVRGMASGQMVYFVSK